MGSEGKQGPRKEIENERKRKRRIEKERGETQKRKTERERNKKRRVVAGSCCFHIFIFRKILELCP